MMALMFYTLLLLLQKCFALYEIIIVIFLFAEMSIVETSIRIMRIYIYYF